jgi:NCS2 family nucleobase:cation symporter-2
VVIGNLITIIGISLMPPPSGWAAAIPMRPTSAASLLLGLATIVITLFIYARFRGFVGNLAVLLGLVAGTAIAAACGLTDFAQVGKAAWFELSRRSPSACRSSDWCAALIMALAMLVIMAETTGNCLAIARCGHHQPADPGQCLPRRRPGHHDRRRVQQLSVQRLHPEHRADRPVQRQEPLCGGQRGRHHDSDGTVPKLGALIASVPRPVLGGCAIVMFGMTTVAGIQELSRVRFEGTRNALVVPSRSAWACCPCPFPLFAQADGPLKLVLESGIFLGAISAVLLNLILNRARRRRRRNHPPPCTERMHIS